MSLRYYTYYTVFQFLTQNYVYKHCGDACNDVILMPQFLEVVRQHILGVVDREVNYFVI